MPPVPIPSLGFGQTENLAQQTSNSFGGRGPASFNAFNGPSDVQVIVIAAAIVAGFYLWRN